MFKVLSLNLYVVCFSFCLDYFYLVENSVCELNFILCCFQLRLIGHFNNLIAGDSHFLKFFSQVLTI